MNRCRESSESFVPIGGAMAGTFFDRGAVTSDGVTTGYPRRRLHSPGRMATTPSAIKSTRSLAVWRHLVEPRLRRIDEHRSAPYSVLIHWSAEDDAFLVTLPDWNEHVFGPVGHGSTYEETSAAAQIALEQPISIAIERGQPLPTPQAQRVAA